MTTNHHTPYVANVSDFRASVMNAPLEELDAAITNLAGSTLSGTRVTTVGNPGTDENIPTEKAVRTGLSEKSDTGHTHDDRYYTDDEIDTMLSGIGGGDVVGPAANSDGYVPQWDGVNSKTLKNGVLLGTAATADLGTGSGNAAYGNHGHTLDGGVGITFEATVKPAANGEYSLIMPYAMTVPANCSGSGFYNKMSPSAQVVVSIKKNGTEFATLTVATNGTPTWASSSTVLSAGDRVSFVFPAQDSTWAGVVITVKGQRSIL